MQLLVVRHAIAEDPAAYARHHRDDAGRPLTPEGRKKMRQAADGLRSLVPEIDLLATSPLTRVIQTADILAAAYDGLEPVQVPALSPGEPVATLATWLEKERRHQTVAIVGHEPGLSQTVSWLLAGGERSFIEIKKGAVCLLEFANDIGAGTALLHWALTSSQLRELRG